MVGFQKHLIPGDTILMEALQKLNDLAADAILFVVDKENRLIGSLTDGDVRRGLLKGLSSDDRVKEFIRSDPKYIVNHLFEIEEIIDLRKKNFKVIPIVDNNKRMINIINFRFLKSYLPIDVVVMAGGRGERLRPMTDLIPKPLLQVGDKTIIDHNIDRLVSYGINNFSITVGYLADHIEKHFEGRNGEDISIRFVREEKPLGTIGSIRKINPSDFNYDTVLLTNSDILTNLDYEDFYLDFKKRGSSLSVATVPYLVKVPYAVMETSNNHVLSFKEKPTYTYYSNGGVYLIKRELLELIPEGFYNATDFMQALIKSGHQVNSYPLNGYWLDIGNVEDYEKARIDFEKVKLL